MIYNCEYIPCDQLNYEYNLGWDEMYRSLINTSQFIVKSGSKYYHCDHHIALSANKILRFVWLDERYLPPEEYSSCFAFNAILTELYGTDIFVQVTGISQTPFFYYEHENKKYFSKKPFAAMNEIREIFQAGNEYYDSSSQERYMIDGVKYGSWSKQMWVTGPNAGKVYNDPTYSNENVYRAEPSNIDIGELYDNTSNVYISDAIAGEYINRYGNTKEVGYKQFTYTEVIDDVEVNKIARKGIELHYNQNADYSLGRWFIDEYRTQTEPNAKYNNQVTLTRPEDGKTINITFEKYVSANEPILVSGGQSWA